ncbi:hypothetical protein [Rhodococcus sp. NPDC060176]|uniref:hypothetical protein n=1 Tax=Rhodococcus sp. NPDC060176 TaxID=3347062 RepID=UPI003669B8A4
MREYNGAPAPTAIVSARTVLWRNHRTDSSYAANNFKSTRIAPLAEGTTVRVQSQASRPGWTPAPALPPLHEASDDY